MIETPGVHTHLTEAEYHADPALGSTGLRNVLKSPLTYYARHLDPNRPIEEPSAAMRAGTLLHLLLLQPLEFDTQYVVRPDWVDGRKKDGKEWLELNKDRICLTDEEMSVAEGQVRSIMSKPEIAKLIEGGTNEEPMFWRDPQTGVMCKIKPDCVKRLGSGAVMVDVKTTSDPSPDQFAKSCGNFGYHIQEAYYTEGYQRVHEGCPVLGFVFVAVGSQYPYDCAAYMLDDAAKIAGAQKIRQGIDTYANCLRTGQWPGLSDAIQTLSLPPWTLKD